MREERYHIALDKYDKNIVINALNTLRTQQLKEERPTEPVDELISKVAHAPTKRLRSCIAGAMRNDDQKTSLILSACGILPVVWLALLTAPYVSGGLVEIIRGLPVAMGNPFEITMCEDSVKTVLIFYLPTLWASAFIFYTQELPQA